jgi:hypothetical protein
VEAVTKQRKRIININREELWALTSFCGDKEAFSAVHFRINGRAQLEAASSDGKCSIQCVGKASGCDAGEWAIDCAYLEQCKMSLGKGQSLAIELSKTGVEDALIIDAESGDTISTVKWHREAASTQLSFGEVVRGLKIPSDKNHSGSWAAIDPQIFGRLTRVKVATDDCPVTIYPPKDPSSLVYFEARSEHGHWKGAIVPEKVLGPGEEADEPEEEDEGAPGRSDRQTRLDLADRAKAKPKDEAEDVDDEDDGIIDDEEAEQLKAQQEATSDEPELETSKRKRKVKPSQMKSKKKGRGK